MISCLLFFKNLDFVTYSTKHHFSEPHNSLTYMTCIWVYNNCQLFSIVLIIIVYKKMLCTINYIWYLLKIIEYTLTPSHFNTQNANLFIKSYKQMTDLGSFYKGTSNLFQKNSKVHVQLQVHIIHLSKTISKIKIFTSLLTVNL